MKKRNIKKHYFSLSHVTQVWNAKKDTARNNWHYVEGIKLIYLGDPFNLGR